MSKLSSLNLGIVGIAGRGGSFKVALEAIENIRLHAACDLNESGLEKARTELGVTETFTDYDDMISSSEIDAVIIGTPMPRSFIHLPMSRPGHSVAVFGKSRCPPNTAHGKRPCQ